MQYNRRSGKAPLKLSGCRIQTLAVDCGEVDVIHVTILLVGEHPYVPGPIIEILQYPLDMMYEFECTECRRSKMTRAQRDIRTCLAYPVLNPS